MKPKTLHKKDLENQMQSNSPEGDLEAFLSEASFGYLTFHTGKHADTTPINFVYMDGDIWFHGSRNGNKGQSLKKNAKAHFSVAKEYGIIASYFSDPVKACRASAFFKSVILYGQVNITNDLQDKLRSLNALMKKLQPEGGYTPFGSIEIDYTAELQRVSLLRLRVERISFKYNFGQNLNEERWQRIVDELNKRNAPRDQQLVSEMIKWRSR